MNGTINPSQHNAGDVSEAGPYTSWSDSTLPRAQHRGMRELVHHLEEMTPQSQVEQFSFQGKDSTALLFFKRRDREFPGSIFVERVGR